MLTPDVPHEEAELEHDLDLGGVLGTEDSGGFAQLTVHETVDDLRIYERVLDASDVMLLYTDTEAFDAAHRNPQGVDTDRLLIEVENDQHENEIGDSAFSDSNDFDAHPQTMDENSSLK